MDKLIKSGELSNRSNFSIPDNILKRLLKNVYFILGYGAEVADELSRRHGVYVYHTCDHRLKHSQNADPQYQPGLCVFEDNIPDYFARDPEETRRIERDVVHDFTPMVIMDLIQLTATHEKVICENDIDIDSIFHIVTHTVMITNYKAWDGFIEGYKDAIRSRNIPDGEKETLIRKVDGAWGKGKSENPRGDAQYGIKQIVWDDNSTAGQIADDVAEYFGFTK